MQRYRILHRTCYSFSAPARLRPHVLHLRLREDHELRIESSTLTIEPPAALSGTEGGNAQRRGVGVQPLIDRLR
ncbi:transglutaminase N-terminal domain-containing protein [Allochromatium vinosum]|uniref:Transglutaminase domain protein n=1 Tax=Allochromatium vinosum (strain ATCC 17899 / DSM 180 / NBRC 103801 / NCIMB 10441 / D) TaxID=572477 RepID=D3RSE8_ALLVD|nr:transglutaminase domain protein [Allochromatium vinosum DSM 180]